MFLLFIIWYTDSIVFKSPAVVLTIEDILFYSLPSIVMFFILLVGWKHERFEGIAILSVSFVFLGIYHVYVSLASFFLLLFIGTLLLIDDYKISHHKR